MSIGAPFGVKIIIVLSLLCKQDVQERGDSDDEEVEWSENLGVHGMAVHFVADGEVVVGHVRMEEGEAAQRQAPASVGEF